jgi:hypothetical protein
MEKTIWIGSLFDLNRKSKTCPELCRRIQNRKWVGLFAIVVALTVCGARAEAQQSKKVVRLGFLIATSPSTEKTRIDSFLQGMRELGYVEGKNLVIEWRYAALVLASVAFFSQRPRVAELAIKHRMPAVYQASDYVEAGGLMTYGVSITDLFRRAATYIDEILKGAKPADLLVEQPTKFEFVINLKAAKQIGLTIPPGV